MRGNFEKVMPHILAHEGGYVDDPYDAGGATKYGITFNTLMNWRGKPITKTDVQKLTIAEATSIYRKNYSAVVRFDDLPPGVDYAVLDYAINSGPARAKKALQSVLNHGLVVDGVIGPQTMAVLGTTNPATVVNRLCDQRMAFLKNLPRWKRYGVGWSRRVKEVRSIATQLANGGQPASVPMPTTPLPKPVPSKSNTSVWAAAIAAIGAAIAAALKYFGVW
jgi:lysozyme family protein